MICIFVKDRYNMMDKDKQELVLSRMLNDEAKSKLKSIGIQRGKVEDNLETLVKTMKKHLIKREQSATLLKQVLIRDGEYSLKKQMKINDNLGNALNAFRRNEEWKEIIDSVLEVEEYLFTYST